MIFCNKNFLNFFKQLCQYAIKLNMAIEQLYKLQTFFH